MNAKVSLVTKLSRGKNEEQLWLKSFVDLKKPEKTRGGQGKMTKAFHAKARGLLQHLA
jgi:hypothetical protein